MKLKENGKKERIIVQNEKDKYVNEKDNKGRRESLTSILIKISVLVLLAVGTLLLLIVYIRKNFSSLPKEVLKIPTSLEDAKQLSNAFLEYSKNNEKKIAFVYSYLYIWKSSFGLPGSIVMNILGGSIFGEIAIPLVVVLSSIGSSICYGLSKIFLGSVLNYFAKEKLLTLKDKIKKHENNLFYYLLFIRLFPITPNWFINIASPLLHIPFIPHFFFSNLIGLLSYNIVTTQAGLIIMTLQSTKEILNAKFMARTLPLSLLALIPPVFGKKIKAYFKKNK